MSLAFCGYQHHCSNPTAHVEWTHVRSVLHGLPPGGNLGGVTLDESGVDGVGEGKLGEVLRDILLHLVLLETGGLSEGLGRDDGGGVGFVSDGREVLVGDNSDLSPCQPQDQTHKA